MLLTLTTTHCPATDLGYLLHKHPDKRQSVEINHGKAHLFYPEASDQRTTAALLLEMDTVGMVRNTQGPAGPMLEAYVNDRPYVASSFMSVAIAKAFSSALNGTCRDKPELVETPLPFEVSVSVVPVAGARHFCAAFSSPWVTGWKQSFIRSTRPFRSGAKASIIPSGSTIPFH